MEKRNKKVTIQDIADALGISRNTVSKAINNSEGLAEETRERILQKAAEMGYKQFSYVNTLINTSKNLSRDTVEAAPKPKGFSGEIALLTGCFLSNSHFATVMLDKFQQEISQLGFTMNTHRVTDIDFANRTLPVTLDMEQVKAILCIEIFDWDYAEMLCDLDIPVLFVDGPSKRNGKELLADQLYMNNTTEIIKLIHDMHQRGINRIGFIGDYDHCQSFYERYVAYYRAMVMTGSSICSKYLIKANTFENMYQKIAALDELPDLFICANDFIAGDVIQVLHSLGKSVPKDVMLSGFDDAPESRMSNPPLTTVHIHTSIIAFSAVHLLISRLKEPSVDYRTVYTATGLIYRASTGNTEGEK